MSKTERNNKGDYSFYKLMGQNKALSFSTQYSSVMLKKNVPVCSFPVPLTIWAHKD